MIMIWQLVSPKDQRIYKIIELLFDSDQTVTINTIAKETNSSIRTIKYDLTDLKKFYPQMKACPEKNLWFISMSFLIGNTY